LKEIEITDIEHGLAVFKPKPEQPVSFAVLQKALKQAGYKLGSAEITVAGTLARDGAAWSLVNDASGQQFALADGNLGRVLEGAQAGARVEITGDWKTVGTGTATREVISPLPTASTTPTSSVVFSPTLFSSALTPDASTRSTAVSLPSSDASPSSPSASLPLAPVRTTSPGLTVYKGGAFVARQPARQSTDAATERVLHADAASSARSRATLLAHELSRRRAEWRTERLRQSDVARQVSFLSKGGGVGRPAGGGAARS
jgi:hypothetical protein